MRPVHLFASRNDFWIILSIAFILFCCFACTGISQPDQQIKEQASLYKKDMEVCVDGLCAEGLLVAPMRESYKISTKSKGVLDLFTFATCHREETSTEFSSGWFGLGGSKEFEGHYIPQKYVEAGIYCPIYLGGYNKKGMNSWGFIDFETPEATLKAVVICNGKTVGYNGVSVCQSKAGLMQAIAFQEPVTSNCVIKVDKVKNIDFEMPKGEHVCAFLGESGRLHRLTLFGYEKILIRD